VEEEVFDLIRKNLGSANMFTFGIGSSVNRHIIEGMAHVGQGEAFVIEKEEVAEAQAARFRNMIQSPVLTQVKVDFDGFKTYDVEPIAIPDVLAERPVLVFGKWRGYARGTITLSGITGDGKYSETINVENYQLEKNNAALKYLWARQRILLLSDYNKLRSDDKRIREVADLGLTYNLLTAYTSFVAVDNEVRNIDGHLTTVKQPLPLPLGVSDYAVGGYGNYPASAPVQSSYGHIMTMKAKSSPHAAYAAKASRELAYLPQEEKKEQRAITLDELTVTNGLAKSEVRKVILTQLHELQKCFAGKNIQGEITVELTINSDGTVKKVEIPSRTLLEAKVQKCVIDKVNKWFFPEVKSAKGVTVKIILKI
jgi:Ca-activated chloride channel homolog